MPVKFVKGNYCWKLSEKRLLTVILISSGISAMLDDILDILQRWKNDIMPVKFAKGNYCWKLSEKRLLTVIMISSGILL